jgi:hypothetical protein
VYRSASCLPLSPFVLVCTPASLCTLHPTTCPHTNRLSFHILSRLLLLASLWSLHLNSFSRREGLKYKRKQLLCMKIVPCYKLI